ncbi:lamin tail domain-containing protein [Salinirubrum litoreum]|uniref:Lamin tail domain-containing protein n=1 Tax=Salinirubrum litoreum TaxID=1126234 RepID=A0ABD5RAL3_9EURY|nr:lamin tail domain-containing protein [Salinirubrum litoreum]
MRVSTLLVVALLLLAGCTAAPPPAESSADTTTPDSSLGPSPTPHPATSPQVTAEVVEVVDGDTIKIRYENGSRDTVRLLGVDTPEVHTEVSPDEFGVPDTDAGRDCLRTWGERASQHAKDTLAGETVQLGFDPNEGKRGYYGRLLAYVYVDGESFNYGLIRQGYARMYDSDFVDRPRFSAAETEAQSDGRGVWGECATADPTASTGATDDTDDTDGTSGSDATASTTTDRLAVSVVADAEGNDNENLNGEYVTLRNRGDDSLDLSGWQITDEAGKTYTFPDGTTLAGGATLRVHSGSGADDGTDYYWNRSGAVWNNGGDTVRLSDADGELVVSLTY